MPEWSPNPETRARREQEAKAHRLDFVTDEIRRKKRRIAQQEEEIIRFEIEEEELRSTPVEVPVERKRDRLDEIGLRNAIYKFGTYTKKEIALYLKVKQGTLTKPFAELEAKGVHKNSGKKYKGREVIYEFIFPEEPGETFTKQQEVRRTQPDPHESGAARRDTAAVAYTGKLRGMSNRPKEHQKRAQTGRKFKKVKQKGKVSHGKPRRAQKRRKDDQPS